MPLHMEVCLDPSDIVLDGDRAPPPEKWDRVPQPPIFDPCLLGTNSCMDQDATWYGGRPQPRPHCARWGPRSHSPEKGAQPHQFSAMFVVAKQLDGSRCQHATWYDGRPQSRQHCVRCRPSSTTQGVQPPQISTHVCCGQTAGWIKIPLSTKVGLSPGRIVSHGDPDPPSQKGHSPHFWTNVYCGLTVAHHSYC